MFRHLEIVKRKKKEELAAIEAPSSVSEPTVRIETDEDGAVLSRRTMLFGMGSTAAVAAMPAVLSGTEAVAGTLDPIRAGQKRIDTAMAEAQRYMNSPEFLEALKGRGPRPIATVLNALRRIEAADTFGTAYDVTKELMDHAVQVAYGTNSAGKRVVGLIPAKAGPAKYMPETVGAGNGLYWNRKDVFVVPQHLLDMIHQKPLNTQKIDVAVLKLPPENHARDEQIIHDDPTLTDAAIHGQPVFIAGIDKDKSALTEGPVGCKILGGNAVQCTREWVDIAFAKSPPYLKERMYRSFMVEIPKQETDGETIESRLISGISGSEVWMVKNGRKIFAGIFHMATGTPEKGLAFFYPASVVREAYEHYMRNVASL